MPIPNKLLSFDHSRPKMKLSICQTVEFRFLFFSEASLQVLVRSSREPRVPLMEIAKGPKKTGER